MNKLYKTSLVAASVLFALGLGSCKPDNSKPPIKKMDMVALLVDVHIAQSVVARQMTIPPDMLNRDMVYKSVLDKHGINEAEFDSAVAWYSRHAMQYKQVYKAVSDTLLKRRNKY